MKQIDNFAFKAAPADGPVYHDYTPYDDEIPKAFRAETPPPPPFDVEIPNPAMDLLIWAVEDIA